MSRKIYNALSEETVFDMAIKLYNDARGVNELISMNPGLDLNASTYFGQPIYYDDAVVYKKQVFPTSVPSPGRQPWRVLTGQNLFDLVIQVYGDLSSLSKILSQVDNLDDPAVGTLLKTEFTDNTLANSLFSRENVATSGPQPEGPGGIGFMIIESTFIVG